MRHCAELPQCLHSYTKHEQSSFGPGAGILLKRRLRQFVERKTPWPVRITATTTGSAPAIEDPEQPSRLSSAWTGSPLRRQDPGFSEFPLNADGQ